MWLNVGSSRLSSICCNFLISSLGDQHVAAHEDGIEVAVESPEGFLLIHLFGPRETQPSVLYFYYLCGSCSPNMNWMLLNRSNANKEELPQLSAETLLPSCLCHRGQRWDKWGISRHLVSLSTQSLKGGAKKKKTHLLLCGGDVGTERWETCPAVMIFSGELVSQNAVFVWEMIETDLDNMQKSNGGKPFSWFSHRSNDLH